MKKFEKIYFLIASRFFPARLIQLEMSFFLLLIARQTAVTRFAGWK